MEKKQDDKSMLEAVLGQLASRLEKLENTMDMVKKNVENTLENKSDFVEEQMVEKFIGLEKAFDMLAKVSDDRYDKLQKLEKAVKDYAKDGRDGSIVKDLEKRMSDLIGETYADVKRIINKRVRELREHFEIGKDKSKGRGKDKGIEFMNMEDYEKF